METKKYYESLLIKSSQRNTGGTSTNFTVAWPKPIQAGRYAVKNVLFPNNIYPVNSTNNVIYFSETAALTSQIPSGSYTGTTLASAVGTAMTASSTIGSVYTGTFNSVTGLLTITSTNNFSLTFGTNTTSSAGPVLGFITNTATSTSLTSQQTVNLALPLSLAIMIADAQSETNVYTQQQLNAQIYFPLTVGFGQLQSLSQLMSFDQYITFSWNVSTLKITVLDTATSLIINNNDADWELLLQRC